MTVRYSGFSPPRKISPDCTGLAVTIADALEHAGLTSDTKISGYEFDSQSVAGSAFLLIRMDYEHSGPNVPLLGNMVEPYSQLYRLHISHGVLLDKLLRCREELKSAKGDNVSIRASLKRAPAKAPARVNPKKKRGRK